MKNLDGDLETRQKLDELRTRLFDLERQNQDLRRFAGIIQSGGCCLNHSETDSALQAIQALHQRTMREQMEAHLAGLFERRTFVDCVVERASCPAPPGRPSSCNVP
jgi:hypothetical protein